MSSRRFARTFSIQSFRWRALLGDGSGNRAATSNRFAEYVGSLLDWKPHHFAGMEETIDMLLHAEHGHPTGRIVHRHIVEDERSALMGVGHDMNRRIRPGPERPVDPDQPIHHA